MLGNFLRAVISPPYRDVLPFFQQSLLIQALGTDIAHAACRAGLQRDPEVVALLATLTDDQHAALAQDEDLEIRELHRRAILSKLLVHNAGLEEALVSLYRKECVMQVQLRELQTFVAAVRGSAPFALRRRLAPMVHSFVHGVQNRIGRLSMRLRGGRPSWRP